MDFLFNSKLPLDHIPVSYSFLIQLQTNQHSEHAFFLFISHCKSNGKGTFRGKWSLTKYLSTLYDICQHPEILNCTSLKVHSYGHNSINKDKWGWGPAITQRLPSGFITPALVLFLGSSEAGRGYTAPQRGNVILLRGQLAQGQGAQHGAARPLHPRVHLGVNLLNDAPQQGGSVF